VFAKWVLVRSVEEALHRSRLSLSMMPDKQRFAEGETVNFAIKAPSPGTFIVFDIGADGSVSLIVPESGERAGVQTDAEGRGQFSIDTSPPDGIDHIVVVVSRSEMSALAGLLRDVHGRALGVREEESLLHALILHTDTLAIKSFQTERDQR